MTIIAFNRRTGVFEKAELMTNCDVCDGDGRVEVCAVGHGSANCPCPTRRRTCIECEGTGRRPMTDDEMDEVCEEISGAGQSVTPKE